jgi:type I restriction enzyme M protein
MVDKSINVSKEVGFIWEIADDLRGDFKQYEFQDIILPFIVLRRLEIRLEKTRNDVKDELFCDHPAKKFNEEQFNTNELIGDIIQGKINYNNTSQYTFKKLVGDDEKNIKENFSSYLDGYSENIKHIFVNFGFYEKVKELAKNKLLLTLIKKFSNPELDFLSPYVTSNEKMGYIFEDLIRRFAEQSNETAGEHFTPREVIELMIRLLGIEDFHIREGKDINIYDPACGTGGMLTMAENYVKDILKLNNSVNLYGQELNPKSYAVCYSDMLLKGENPTNIKEGNTLVDDKLEDYKFDFMLSNPPFGVSWTKYADKIIDKKTKKILMDKFSMGVPRSNDGSLLFLLHMISKMRKTQDGGSGIAIVFSGSPLFSGDAGSGESNIRKYLMENDLVETIVALPTNLFYNTGIGTYVWIIKNNKTGTQREGKVQLINAVDFYEKMKKSLGDKRHYVTQEQMLKISKIHKDFKEGEFSKIFKTTDFGYTKVSLTLDDVDEEGKKIKVNDAEKIPLNVDKEEYLKKEVELPYKIKKEVVGYEINFTQYFYKYEKLRKVGEIAGEIKELEKENLELLKEIEW